MGTYNFKTQKDFGLWVNHYDYYDEAGDYIDYDEYSYDEAADAVELFNETLEFYQVELRAGYYDGTQFYVKENDNKSGGIPNPRYYTAKEWRDWRTEDYYREYYFPYPYSVAMRKLNSEIKRINKWFATVGKELGFRELSACECMGFAIYSYKDETEQKKEVATV